VRTLGLLLFSTIGTCLVPSAPQAAPVHEWSQRFGNNVDQIGNCVAADALGNVVITGELNGTVDFGGGPLTSAGGADIFVARFDANGIHIWSKRFGSANTQIGYSVATNLSGNVAITGELNGTADFGGGALTSAGGSDIFVARFDANGNHLWSKRFGDNSNQLGNSVAFNGSGSVLVTGELRGTVDFGGGPLTSGGGADIFVAKLDANGNHLWSKRFGGGSNQIGNSIATDASSNVVCTGEMGGTVDFGGGALTSGGGIDIFVVKLDSNGNHIWSKRFGGAQTQSGESVAVDGPGNVAITGELNGTADFGGGVLTSAGGADVFVAKFNSSGTHLWSRRIGSTNDQIGASIAAVSSGHVVVTGRFETAADFGGGALNSAGGFDIFLADYDAAGSHAWSQRFGGTGNQFGNAVATDGTGGIVLTGRLSNSADFGGGTLTSAGGIDVYLTKFYDQYVVPVLITSFDAKNRNGVVEVIWDVWSDEGLESFTLYRRDDARPLPIVVAEGPFDPTTRSYVDASVEPGKTYHYELSINTSDGDHIRSAVATVTVPLFETALIQNFPNPFRPATTIEYTLGERSHAVVGIYDVAGRLVIRLDQGVRDVGTHRVEWNGRDADGRLTGSGVYFYRLENAPNVAPRKMLRLK
jgi:uncharacterized protein (AIM24 family)